MEEYYPQNSAQHNNPGSTGNTYAQVKQEAAKVYGMS
jgi:hypothetical protein